MKLVKEIKSQEGVLHFQRWRMVETPFFNLYLHKIHKADEDRHLHNHPWNFFVLCIRGSYVEDVSGKRYATVMPWSFRYRNRKAYHKILKIVKGPVTTLVFTFGKKRVWGYDVDGKFVDHETYRRQKHHDQKMERFERIQKEIKEFDPIAKMLKVKGGDMQGIKNGIEKLVKDNEALNEQLKKLKNEKN